MDEALVANWNAVVKPEDKVYHLGDVVINRKHLQTVGRLNGSKRLVLGNHDIFDVADYSKYFKYIHGSLKCEDVILTHIPIHPESIPRWCIANVHGHIHAEVIPHPRYFNVSVENINFIPIEFSVLRDKIKAGTFS